MKITLVVEDRPGQCVHVKMTFKPELKPGTVMTPALLAATTALSVMKALAQDDKSEEDYS